MSFNIYECYVAKDGSIQRKLVAQCNSSIECFSAFRERGHKVQGARIHNRTNQTETISAKKTKKACDFFYDSNFKKSNYRALNDSLDCIQVRTEVGARFYLIRNTGEVGYTEFCQQHQEFCSQNANKWSWRARWRKAFHPGNFLTLALLCVGTGLILTALFPPIGLAAAPFLAFFAVGFAAVAAIIAVDYAIDWLKREYEAYKTEEAANGHQASFFSLSFIKHCFAELKDWAIDHPVQTTLMVIGALLLLGALTVTAGYFIAPAIFGFMALGAAGGAIGLTTGFFGTGFSIAASGGLLSILASIFAGAALVLGPTHILDTIRRVVNGWFKDNSTQNTYFIEDGGVPDNKDNDIPVLQPAADIVTPEERAALQNKLFVENNPDRDALNNQIRNNLGDEVEIDDTELKDFLGDKEESDVEKNSDDSSNTSSDDEENHKNPLVLDEIDPFSSISI